MTESNHNRIGRNDPCYCGSGKKYKHCHGAAASPGSDVVYNRLRMHDAESANHILRYAKGHYGAKVMERAWNEYRLTDGTRFDVAGPDGDSFTRWFMFNWKPANGVTLAEMILAEGGAKIDPDLRRFIEATVNAPYSYYQTIDARSGEGVTIRDILRRRELHVTERSASTMLKPGHILLARVVEVDGCSFFMGTGAMIIPPVFLDRILDFREYLEGRGAKAGEPVSGAILLDHEEDLRELYFELQDELNRPPEIRNTDGDPLAFHTLTFEIPSYAQAFEALKDLEQKATGMADEEMLEEAKRNRTGTPTELTLQWLRKGYKGGFGDSTTLATLTIGKSRLVVEVNSERRARRVQKEIRKRLGDSAVLLRTEIRSHEGLMKGIAKGGKGKETEQDRLMRESPEVKAMMKEMMDRHWERWLDESIPALRGMTPRQAAKDRDGRELLESLLMDFELRNESAKDDSLRVDVGRLRKELGLGGE
ncbi:MAG: SEC-C metal-binding domain-containing protein [Bacteroidota bacterium]